MNHEEIAAQTNQQLKNLPESEKKVIRILQDTFGPDWKIYIHPHLNGLRPSFLFINPKGGIAVVDVYDWTCESDALEGVHPVDRLEMVDEFLHELFPTIMETKPYARHCYEKYMVMAIFPFLESKTVYEMILDDLVNAYRIPINRAVHSILGADKLNTDHIRTLLITYLSKRKTDLSDRELYSLRQWIIEPHEFGSEQVPLVLDQRQLELCHTRTESGYRRIRGPAGSGKSMVLASRAAVLAQEGKDVLVITFNITLKNYLRELSARWDWTNSKINTITWFHYHAWCKQVCLEAGKGNEYRTLMKKMRDPHQVQNVLRYELTELVNGILGQDNKELVARYDAVLVDEGQDFLPEWWQVLRKVCREGGEMLLVADTSQDIYDTAKNWTDEVMAGAGFSGPWTGLGISYRIPYGMQEHIRTFAQEFLDPDSVVLPMFSELQTKNELSVLKWIDAYSGQAARICAEEIIAMKENVECGPIGCGEIVFLCGDKNFGEQVKEELEKRMILTIDTFSKNQHTERKQKEEFFMSDKRVKLTTIHSFKGWEARAIVLHLDQTNNAKQLPLAYTGLSRLSRHPNGSLMTVVSSSLTLSDYGKRWPQYENIDPF